MARRVGPVKVPVSCTATDAAGNSASASFLIIVQDTTPPTITSSRFPPPNAAGWHNSNVAVTWSVADPESGIASSSGCDAITLTTDTAGVTL